MAYEVHTYNRGTKQFRKYTTIEMREVAKKFCDKCRYPARVTSEFGTPIYYNAPAKFYGLDRIAIVSMARA